MNQKIKAGTTFQQKTLCFSEGFFVEKQYFLSQISF